MYIVGMLHSKSTKCLCCYWCSSVMVVWSADLCECSRFVTDQLLNSTHPKWMPQNDFKFRSVFSHKQQSIAGYVFIDLPI